MTEIQKKLQRLIAAGVKPGKALSGEIPISQNWQSPGRYQRFENGVIVSSEQFGAYYLSKRVAEKWESASVKNTLYNPLITLWQAIGYPVADTAKTADGAEICIFQQGMIIGKKDGKSFVVAGAVFERYLEEMSAGPGNIGQFPGWMGYPTEDIKWRTSPPDKGNQTYVVHVGRFQHGDLFYKEGRDRALWVRGDIRKFYNKWSDIGSKLGCPISDEHPITREDPATRLNVEIGWACAFEEGVIFWSLATGAHALPNLLAKAYIEQYGGPAGDLGFPLMEPKTAPSGRVYVNFQNGFLYQQNELAPVQRITSMSVRVVEFDTNGSDDDLAVKATVTVREPGKAPLVFGKNYGEYSNGNFDIKAEDKFMCSFPIRNAETLVSMHMVASEVDNFLNFEDDPLGEFTRTYSFNNLWDTGLPDISGLRGAGGAHKDRNFTTTFSIQLDNIVVDPNNSEHFRQNLWWDSENYKVPELSKEQYAETFTDVEADDGFLFHPFNSLFYVLMYRTCADNGVCFGMCAEAIYALKNDSVSRQHIAENYKAIVKSVKEDPTQQRSPDETRDRTFRIKHGYQIGGDQIAYFTSELVAGNMWDPIKTYHRSQSMFKRGDFPILCLSDGATSGKGHAVIPYDWIPGESTLTILIADPNRPREKYKDDKSPLCCIVIDKKTEKFTYIYSEGDPARSIAPDIWRGGSGAFNGGRFFPIPYSHFSSRPHTPFWEIGLAGLATVVSAGFLAKAGFTMILFGGNAGTSRIRNERGETYFEHLDDLRASDRIKNLTHITPANANPLFGQPRLFVLDASPNTRTPMPISHSLTHSKWHLGHIATAAMSHVFAKRIQPDNIAALYEPALVEALQLVFKEREAQSVGATLHFDMFNFGEEQYTWCLNNAFTKAVLTANAILDSTDRVTGEALHTVGQSLSFQAADPINQEAPPKVLKAHFISPDSQRAFVLENIGMARGKVITFQHNNGLKQLIVHNSDNATSADLTYFANGNPTPSMVLPQVSLPANSVTLFEALEAQSIRQEVYEHLEGPLISTQTFSKITLDCRKLVHEWLVLFKASNGIPQTSLDQPAGKEDSGSWFYAKDRAAAFILDDGEYGFNVQSGVLSVVRFKVEDGKIVYDTTLEGILKGAGTNTLILNGLPLTIDGSAVKDKLVFLPSVYGASGDDLSKINRPLVTGNFLPTSTDGKDGWDYFFNIAAGKMAKFTFKCCTDGKVRFSTAFKAAVKGNGTKKIVISKLD